MHEYERSKVVFAKRMCMGRKFQSENQFLNGTEITAIWDVYDILIYDRVNT